MTWFLTGLGVCLLAAGLWLALSAALHLPGGRARKAIAFLTGGMVSPGDAFVRPLAVRLAKWIRLNPYKKQRLQNKLDFAKADMTPEYYTAYSYALGLWMLPVLLLTGYITVRSRSLYLAVVTVLLAMLAWQIVRRSLRRVVHWTIMRHNTLEMEWPRLGSHIRQSLAAGGTPDVRRLLKGYLPSAGAPMREELEITLADMATGSPDMALEHLAARADSENATALMQILIGVEKGEDMQTALDGLDRQLREWEITALREEAENRPAECQSAQLYLLLSMIVLWGVVIGIAVVQNLNAFGMY